MKLPAPIVAVVEAARRVVHVRRDLDHAKKSGEVSEKGVARRREDLNRALTVLDKSVMVIEKQLEEARMRRRGTAVPWASVFRAGAELVSLLGRAKAGENVTKDAASWAGRHAVGGKDDDIIDGELVD